MCFIRNARRFCVGIIAAVLALTAAETSYAAWPYVYNGTGNMNDYARSIAVDGAGNSYVVGDAVSSALTEITTFKIGPAGNTVWVRRYPGRDGMSVALDSAGNVFTSGTVAGAGGTINGIIIKYSPTGTRLWLKTYASLTGTYVEPVELAVAADGSVYVFGHEETLDGNADMYLIKYSSAGATAWTRRYNGSGNGWDEAESVAVAPNGNIFITGQTQGPSRYEIATMAYSPTGTRLWTKKYFSGTTGDSDPLDLKVTSANEVVVCGLTRTTGNWNAVLLKYSDVGVNLWTRTLGNATDGEQFFKIAVDGSGKIAVTGRVSYPAYGSDYLTALYSSSGALMWMRKATGNSVDAVSYDLAKGVGFDASGNVLIGGFAKTNPDRDDWNLLFIKYTPAGARVWSTVLDRGLVEDLNAMHVTSSGQIHIAALSETAGRGTDIYINLITP